MYLVMIVSLLPRYISSLTQLAVVWTQITNWETSGGGGRNLRVLRKFSARGLYPTQSTKLHTCRGSSNLDDYSHDLSTSLTTYESTTMEHRVSSTGNVLVPSALGLSSSESKFSEHLDIYKSTHLTIATNSRLCAEFIVTTH